MYIKKENFNDICDVRGIAPGGLITGTMVRKAYKETKEGG